MILFRDDFERYILVIVAALVSILGAAFADNGPILDKLLIACIILSILFCRKNKDTATSLAIVLLGQLLYELFKTIYIQTHIWSISFYLFGAISIVVCSVDRWRYPLKGLIIVCITAHLFWVYQDYNSPFIAWHWFVISINLIQRQLFLIRFSILIKYLNYDSNPTKLDFILRSYYSLPLIIEFANICEYLIRHLTHYNPLVIYSLYAQVHYISLLILLFVTIATTIKQSRDQKLIA